MTDITKKDIEELLANQTQVILQAVDEKLDKMDSRMLIIENRILTVESRLDKIEQNIEKLTNNLEKFLERLTTREQEFTLLAAKVDKMAAFLKDKFGIEFSAQ